MTEIVSFKNIDNMHSVAADFSRLLSRADNADIAVDFPGTARRYSGEVNSVHQELMKSKEQCEDGVREQFIVYAGKLAVGLSAIQLVDEPPEGISTETPNLSGMILNPWRGNGFGNVSLRHRLDIVDERFNGTAYSLVRKDNIISQNMVESNGLVIVGEDDTRFTYLYDGSNR